LADDLTQVGLRFKQQAVLHLRRADGQTRVLQLDGASLITVPATARLGPPSVVLTARGVTTLSHTTPPGACGFRASDVRDSRPVIRLDARGRRFTLAGPEGAALAGLPFPD
jgi:hypothetical protein